MSSADVESTPPEAKDADDKGRKFETTTEATWDIEVKPVELLISEPNNDSADTTADDDDDDDDTVNGTVEGGGEWCNLSSSEGNNIVLL